MYRNSISSSYDEDVFDCGSASLYGASGSTAPSVGVAEAFCDFGVRLVEGADGNYWCCIVSLSDTDVF